VCVCDKRVMQHKLIVIKFCLYTLAAAAVVALRVVAIAQCDTDDTLYNNKQGTK
jgi:hypothetical protein